MYQFICYICLTLSTYFRSSLRLSVSDITHTSLYSSLTSTICALYRTSILFLISDISHLGICSHRCFLSLQFLKTREIHLPLAIKISLFILMVCSFVYETLGKPLNECGGWISGRGGGCSWPRAPALVKEPLIVEYAVPYFWLLFRLIDWWRTLCIYNNFKIHFIRFSLIIISLFIV